MSNYIPPEKFAEVQVRHRSGDHSMCRSDKCHALLAQQKQQSAPTPTPDAQPAEPIAQLAPEPTITITRAEFDDLAALVNQKLYREIHDDGGIYDELIDHDREIKALKGEIKTLKDENGALRRQLGSDTRQHGEAQHEHRKRIDELTNRTGRLERGIGKLNGRTVNLERVRAESDPVGVAVDALYARYDADEHQYIFGADRWVCGGADTAAGRLALSVLGSMASSQDGLVNTEPSESWVITEPCNAVEPGDTERAESVARSCLEGMRSQVREIAQTADTAYTSADG